MRFFKKNAKGVCPECHSVIEDINDNFCSNCGWKISGLKAIKTKTELENREKREKHNKRQAEHEAKAQQHKQDFKESIQGLKSLKFDLGKNKNKEKPKPITNNESKPIRNNENKIVIEITSEDIRRRKEKEDSLSDEEKRILQRIKENEKRVNDMGFVNESEFKRNEAIRLYEENVSYGLYCPHSYYNLSNLYEYNREYDKAIALMP